ncbi:hypothetical protein ABMA27_015233 [Loxostege sticticalis]|uniref:Uncharacterized protein n=1 Tax=Loxostege sticticalis TaxID=481309 RepID=A0ABR3I6W9_LOXSC
MYTRPKTYTIHVAPVHEIHSAPQVHHAVSSQSIVRHESQEKHEAPQHFFVPVHHQPAPVHEVHAVPVVHHIPVHHQNVEHKVESLHHNDHHEEYYAYPKYEFEYKVEDPHTGDNKYQHETRDGDVVKGVYSLHDADGSIRTVEYSSVKKTGFNANVKHSTKHVQQEHHNYHH